MLCRSLWLNGAVFVLSLLWSLSAVPQVPGVTRSPDTVQKIHVVIIGVPQWQLSDYKDSPLGSEIHQTCVDIVKFFKDRFTPEQVEFHPNPDDPCTAEATKYSAIRHLLYTELPEFGQDTLTFLFMMSHGEIDKYDNKFLSQDLRFIASDTIDSEREDTSLSVGIELLNWLQKLPAGSTVLAFVDTCNAGALDTMKLHVDSALQNFLGLKFGLVVASLSDKSTYQANFTRSLLDLWQSETCPDDVESLENKLYDRIKDRTKIKKLVNNDGYPTVLINYGGSWCLKELRAGGKLLFLYQGSLPKVEWHVKQEAVVGGFEKQFTVGHSSFHLMIVPPGMYSVTATPTTGSAKSFPKVDLLHASTQPIFLQAPNTTKEAYSAVNTYQQYAKFKGVSSEESSKLDQITEFAYARAFGENDATAVRGGSERLSPSEVKSLIKDAHGHPKELHEIGVKLLRSGDFLNATTAFVMAASSTTDTKFQRDNAKAAYLAAGAAGSADRAAKVRQRFNFDLGTGQKWLISAETAVLKDKNPQTVDSLKAASTMKLVTDFSNLVAGTEKTEIVPEVNPQQ